MSVDQLPAPATTPPPAEVATLADAQAVIARLPWRELSAFATRFEEFFADEWDNQIERDALAGKFDRSAEQVKTARRDGTLTDR